MGALALAGLEPGDHVCWTFDSEQTRMDATAGFIRSGIRDEHKVMYYTASLTPSDVHTGLFERGIDAAGMTRVGQLEIATAADTYLAGGRFDPNECIDGWSDTCARTKAEGFAALRVIGDMAWATTGVPGAEGLADYEARVNAVYAEGYAMAVCQYDTRLFTAAQLWPIAAAHPGTLRSGGGDREPPLLRIRRVGPARLRLVGDSDVSNRAAFEAALTGLGAEAERHRQPPVLDLTGLQFADSATAGALIDFADRNPTGLTIVGCRPGLRELLDVFGGGYLPKLHYSPTG